MRVVLFLPLPVRAYVELATSRLIGRTATNSVLKPIPNKTLHSYIPIFKNSTSAA
jgi:hypothetical protein